MIRSVEFDWETHVQLAPGSDNWPMTWGEDGHQYTTWGDGGGFGGDNSSGRSSLGVARIEGDGGSYTGHNLWGGVGGAEASFGGKAYGILALDGSLYMWRCGAASGETAYEFQELLRSDDNGVSWTSGGVWFSPASFPDGPGFFCPTFLQFGPGFEGARDDFVYAYAPELKTTLWDVHKPGEITLFRSPRSGIQDMAQYEFFAGLAENGTPIWTRDPGQRAPVFEDAANGVMRTSVNYNEGLQRYFLLTEHTESHAGNIGLFEAPEPWGPWRSVLFERRFGGPHIEPTTFFWAFANKWASEDGLDFVMVFSGTEANDAWNSVHGRFVLARSPGTS